MNPFRLSNNRLLQSRITRWSILAVILAAAGLSVAWQEPAHYRLGGAWMGTAGSGRWSGLVTPLDPTGRTAALRVSHFSYGAEVAGLLAMFGADTLSDSVGEEAMVSNNTGKFTEISYALKQGSPPVNVQIWVFEGTFKFTSPNDLEMNYTLSIYDAAADADGDAFPDPGAKTVIPPIAGGGSAKRVLP